MNKLLFFLLFFICLAPAAYATGSSEPDAEITDKEIVQLDEDTLELRLKCRNINSTEDGSLRDFRYRFICIDGPCPLYIENELVSIPHNEDPNAWQTYQVDNIFPGTTYKFTFQCVGGDNKADGSLVTYTTPSNTKANITTASATTIAPGTIELSQNCQANSGSSADFQYSFACIDGPCLFFNSQLGEQFRVGDAGSNGQSITASVATEGNYRFAAICEDSLGEKTSKTIFYNSPSASSSGIVVNKYLLITLQLDETISPPSVNYQYVNEKFYSQTLDYFIQSQPAGPEANYLLEVYNNSDEKVYELPFSFKNEKSHLEPGSQCMNSDGTRNLEDPVCGKAFQTTVQLYVNCYTNFNKLVVSHISSGNTFVSTPSTLCVE